MEERQQQEQDQQQNELLQEESGPAPAAATPELPAPATAVAGPAPARPSLYAVSPIWAACVASSYLLTSLPGLMANPGDDLAHEGCGSF